MGERSGRRAGSRPLSPRTAASGRARLRALCALLAVGRARHRRHRTVRGASISPPCPCCPSRRARPKRSAKISRSRSDLPSRGSGRAVRADLLAGDRRARNHRRAPLSPLPRPRRSPAPRSSRGSIGPGNRRLCLHRSHARRRRPRRERSEAAPSPPPSTSTLRTRPLSAWLADVARDAGRDLVISPELRGDLTASESTGLEWRQRLEAYSRVFGFEFAVSDGMIEARRGSGAPRTAGTAQDGPNAPRFLRFTPPRLPSRPKRRTKRLRRPAAAIARASAGTAAADQSRAARVCDRQGSRRRALERRRPGST